jgi:uncharacterized protein (DUF488 family)
MTEHELQLWTIGYEGAAAHAAVGALADAGVELLVDVRIRAQSRKPGFSKSTLAAELDRAGIGYEHLRDLGTPLHIKALFRAGELEAGREQYREHLRGDDAARASLARLVDLAGERRTAILCFERDERTCHRMVVCEELARAHPGFEAYHLHP